MNTQIIFNIDKKLKDQAMKKAQNEGMPFGLVLKLATKAFVEGTLGIGLIQEPVFNKRTSSDIEAALKDIKNNKNISPKFKTAKDAIAYLKS
jgi:antitoxin component of RelBE/YafQ-DinJ toxin-antitoxin module